MNTEKVTFGTGNIPTFVRDISPFNRYMRTFMRDISKLCEMLARHNWKNIYKKILTKECET
jgi:hypothetical protein